MYAFGAMLSFTIAHLAVVRLRTTEPRTSGPTAARARCGSRGRELPLFAVLGGARHGARLDHRDRAAPRGRRGRPRLAGARLRRLHALPPPPGARPDDHDARWRSRSPWSSTRRSTSRSWWRSTSATTFPQVVATAIAARGAAAARHPRPGHDHRARSQPDRRRAARAGARRAGDHRAGQAPGRAARLRPLREGPRRAARGG